MCLKLVVSTSKVIHIQAFGVIVLFDQLYCRVERNMRFSSQVRWTWQSSNPLPCAGSRITSQVYVKGSPQYVAAVAANPGCGMTTMNYYSTKICYRTTTRGQWSRSYPPPKGLPLPFPPLHPATVSFSLEVYNPALQILLLYSKHNPLIFLVFISSNSFRISGLTKLPKKIIEQSEPIQVCSVCLGVRLRPKCLDGACYRSSIRREILHCCI